MPKTILIKPIITEKADKLTEELNQYTFVVNKTSNKIEIRNAVERLYNVAVDSVNTMNMPGKSKSRFTRAGVQRGRQAPYKKAIVTLVQGETIDLFEDI